MANIKNDETNFERLLEICTPLLNWYDNQARILPWRENPSPYRVWVSEIMLQQTRVEAVKPYFERFMKELPTVADLANVQEEQLMKLWEGLGYYNRVRNLQKAAIAVMNDFGGEIPDSYEELMTLSGIGSYTAGAIASIAFQKPIPAVDGNVLRVIMRVEACRDDITKSQVKDNMTEKIRKIMPKNRAGDFNQSLMELGAVVCIPNGVPKCEICPIGFLCEGYAMNCMLDLPVKTPKKVRKKEYKIIMIILCNGKLGIKKRKDTGLLASLWELPNIDGHYSEENIIHVLRDWGIEGSVEKLGDSKHIFTHIEWHMSGCIVYTDNMGINEEIVWVSMEEIKADYAVASAFKHYCQIAQEVMGVD